MAGAEDELDDLAGGAAGQFRGCPAGASRACCQCGGVGVELLFELHEFERLGVESRVCIRS